MPVTRPEIDKMVASILKEIEEGHQERSLLNRDSIRAGKAGIMGAIKTGADGLEADAPKKGELYIAVGNFLYDRLEASILKHGGAVPGTVHYSSAAKAASHATHALVNSNRKVLVDRLGNVPAADGYRRQCGVGTVLDPEHPVEVLDIANQQLVVFDDPTFVELAEERDIDAARMKKKLAPAAKELKGHIDAGLGATPVRGVATGDVHENLLAIEILVSRAASWMRTYGNAEGAEILEKKLPKRHGRRSTDKKVPEATGELTLAAQPATPGPVAAGTAGAPTNGAAATPASVPQPPATQLPAIEDKLE